MLVFEDSTKDDDTGNIVLGRGIIGDSKCVLFSNLQDENIAIKAKSIKMLNDFIICLFVFISLNMEHQLIRWSFREPQHIDIREV